MTRNSSQARQIVTKIISQTILLGLFYLSELKSARVEFAELPAQSRHPFYILIPPQLTICTSGKLLEDTLYSSSLSSDNKSPYCSTTQEQHIMVNSHTLWLGLGKITPMPLQNYSKLVFVSANRGNKCSNTLGTTSEDPVL